MILIEHSVIIKNYSIYIYISNNNNLTKQIITKDSNSRRNALRKICLFLDRSVRVFFNEDADEGCCMTPCSRWLNPTIDMPFHHAILSFRNLRPTIAGISKTMRARAVLLCAVYHVRHSAMNVPPDPVISDCRSRYCADYAWSSIAQVNFGNMVRGKRRNGERVPSIIRIILIEVVSELMKKPFRKSWSLRERKKRGIGLNV